MRRIRGREGTRRDGNQPDYCRPTMVAQVSAPAGSRAVPPRVPVVSQIVEPYQGVRTIGLHASRQFPENPADGGMVKTPSPVGDKEVLTGEESSAAVLTDNCA